MKSETQITEERIKIESILRHNYPLIKYKFIDGDFIKIAFSVDNYELDFLYPKERYEPENTMVFKGVKIGSSFKNSKKYPVDQVLSFLRNHFDSFEDCYRIDTISDAIDKTIILIDLLKLEKNSDWQIKLDALIQKKYPW